MPWGTSPLIPSPRPQHPRADIVWKAVLVMGAEVAVYKWTLGCGRGFQKAAGGWGEHGGTVVVTDDSVIKVSFSISAFPQLPTLPHLLVLGFCPSRTLGGTAGE